MLQGRNEESLFERRAPDGKVGISCDVRGRIDEAEAGGGGTPRCGETTKLLATRGKSKQARRCVSMAGIPLKLEVTTNPSVNPNAIAPATAMVEASDAKQSSPVPSAARRC